MTAYAKNAERFFDFVAARPLTLLNARKLLMPMTFARRAAEGIRGHFAQNDTCRRGGDFDVRVRHAEWAKKRMPG